MSTTSASSAPSTPGPGMRAPVSPLEIVRVLVMLVALATFALWGATAWAFPWNIVAGIATPVFTLIVWALFISPRAVVQIHPFVRGLIELLIFVGVTAAWWTMGNMWVGIAYGVVAVATGVIAGRRAL